MFTRSRDVFAVSRVHRGALAGVLTVAGCVGAPPSAEESAGQSARAGRVTICHVDGGGRARELEIDESARDAHMRHGDYALLSFYRDGDGDGFGDAASRVSACAQPSGYVANDDDCNDTRNAVRPGATETCNGVDDDCDGNVDEGNPGGGAACSTDQPGVCSTGTVTCRGGALVCVASVAPMAETCDGLDNDCNGVADNGNPGGGGTCDTGQQGVCSAGTLNCMSGSLTCTPNRTPGDEVCDGLDNDCDGQVDEGNPGGGVACDTGRPGVCAVGTTACANGAVVCNANSAPGVEVCDGLDNDCDGIADDGNPGGGVTCDTGQQGVCSAGTTACSSGAVVCNASAVPTAEVCGDGLDNDCDGVVDDGCVCAPNSVDACYTGAPGTAGVGVCRAGTQTCNATGTAYGPCQGSITPSTEVCGDGLDNDCDGVVDDGCVCAPNSTSPCYTGPPGTAGVGACRNGVRTCNATGTAYGACQGSITPNAEVCGDRLDNDCDGTADEGCCGITLYTGYNFTGTSQFLGAGVHDFPALNVVGNDNTRSIRVLPGTRAELWQHYTPYNGNTFNGNHATFTADDANLDDNGIGGVSSAAVFCD